MADKPLPKVNEAAARTAVLVKLEQPQFKAIERLVVLMTNISDNLYNMTGFMGAQLTSLKETEEALKALAPDEAAQLEANREKDKDKEMKVKEKNPFQKLIDFFEGLINILIPFIVGFFIGLKKEFGLIAALVLVFRKQIFAVLKELPKIISFLAGFLKTAITGAINSLSKAFKGLSAKFPSISGKVAQIASRVVNEFRGVLVAYSSQIEKISKFFSKITSGFKSLGSVSGFVDKFVDAGKAVFNTIANVAKKFTSLTKAFAAGVQSAGKVGEFLGKLGGFFKTFGRFLGPIGAAISIVTSLFTAFKQAFKGFDEEGIFGAIKGFTSGLITGLIGWIGDLGTWLLSKLLGMLGFEELAAKIGEFDFSGFLNETIQGVFDTIKSFFGNMVTTIPNIFSGFIDNITGAFTKIFSGGDIIGGIVQLLSAVPQMLIDLIMSPFEALGEAIKEVFDFDIGTIAKKILIAMFPPDTLVGKAIRGALGDLEAEVAESDKAIEKQKKEKAEAKRTAAAKQEAAKAPAEPGKQQPKQQAKPAEQRKDQTKLAPPKQGAAAQPAAMEPAKQPAGQQAAAVTPAKQPTGQQPAATEPAKQPAQQAAPAMTPVPQQPAPGQALATESQKVAGASAGAPGGSSSQNIVAPVTTTNVSQNSSQNVSMPASATPVFGMQSSFFGPQAPSFGF